MREYETIYILQSDLSDQTAQDFMVQMKQLIEKQGGKNIQVNCMGRRKLAWPRGKSERGIFVQHKYLGNPGLVHEYERNLGNQEAVMLRFSALRQKDVHADAFAPIPDSLAIPVVSERRENYSRHRASDDFGFESFDSME